MTEPGSAPGATSAAAGEGGIETAGASLGEELGAAISVVRGSIRRVVRAHGRLDPTASAVAEAILDGTAVELDAASLADPGSLSPVVRIASVALHLEAAAETHHQAVAAERAGSALVELEAERVAVGGATVCPVLTAHPTEARRLTVLERLTDARSALAAVLTAAPAQRDAAERDLDVAVELLWRTDDVRSIAPTVADEVLFAQAYLDGPMLEAAIRVELAAQPDAPAGAPSRIRLSSWVGGDQDGNPNCGPDDLVFGIRLSAAAARRRHHAFARELHRRASVSCGLDQLSPAAQSWLGPFARDPGRIGRRHAHPQEALRLAAAVIRLGVEPDGEGPPGYRSRTELADHIDLVASELAGLGLRHLVRPLLGRWRALTRIGGLHLVDPDVRTHRRDLRELAGRHSPAALACWDRPADLWEALAAPDQGEDSAVERHPLPAALRRWREELERLPDLGGSLVISGTEQAGDAVAALWLLRRAGIDHRVRVVPLLETPGDLAEGRAIVEQLTLVAPYRGHLDGHGGVQEVMLGYSDSTKVSGYLAAALALRRAHLDIDAAARERSLRVRFFHGRGGTIARGGEPTAEAVRAQPARTLGGELRYTEQGETVSLRYGDARVGAQHLAETLLALAAHNRRLESEPALPDWIEELAASSREVYEAWYAGADHAAFHRRFTPIDAIERLLVGSRPARRFGNPTPQDLRAIPWHFSWAQCRVLASVWYGAGTALSRLVGSRRALGEARQLYRRSVWFRSAIDNLEMVSFKTNWDQAARYLELVDGGGDRALFDRLREEHTRCAAAILAIRGGSALLDHLPGLRSRISARDLVLAPLHALQVQLLRRWRDSGDPETLRLTLATVNGIAAGLQNTG